MGYYLIAAACLYIKRLLAGRIFHVCLAFFPKLRLIIFSLVWLEQSAIILSQWLNFPVLSVPDDAYHDIKLYFLQWSAF